MKISHLLIVPILLFTSLAQAQQAERFAPLSPYIDEQTLLVADFDLQRLSFDAADNKLLALLRASHARKSGPANAADDARDSLATARRWRDDFLKAGGRHIYAVLSLHDLPQELPFLIVPHDEDANVQALRSLLLSGQADGPFKPARTWPGVAEPLSETALLIGVPSQFERVKVMKPAPRPKLKDAAATLPPDAAAAVLVIPSDDVRKALESLLPPLPTQLGTDPARTLSRGLVFASIGTDVSAKSPLSITIQSEDPASAKAIAELIRGALALLTENLPEKPADAALPQPEIVEDRVVVALDAALTRRFLDDAIVPALKADRIRAERVKSATNMRHILQAIHLHLNDARGAWPDTLQQLVRERHQIKDSLKQPYSTASGGYIYLKPAVPLDKIDRPDKTIVLYEENPVDELINVGFADGHVEAMHIKAFEEMKAEQLRRQQPIENERPR